MKIFISEGNTKTGKIPSVSLPPDKTCNPDAPCCASGCYARRLLKMRPSWYATLENNYELYKDDPLDYFYQIKHYLNYANTRFFRWHIAGDIPDTSYFRRVKLLARATPNIKHLIFTKRFDFHRGNWRHIPSNLTLLFSFWSDFGDETIKHPKAWMLNPKNPDPRIPKDALECPGNCEACAMCWNLKELKRDVYFRKH